MRKSKEEAAQTRKRIVSTAAREFRKNGIVATGLNDLMKAAGLTHGGFYKHFESKDQLVAEAYAEALRSMIAMLTTATSGKSPKDAAAVVTAIYLATAHRDQPADGCPLTTLGSEIARSNDKIRAAATDGFLTLVDFLSGRFDAIAPEIARRRALVAVSTMIGAVTMSRIVTDPALSAEILREAEKSLTDREAAATSTTGDGR